VVFGKTDASSVDLSMIANGRGGFAIDGDTLNDAAGLSVSAAGDVNGDGLADLIVGAPSADPGTRTNSGSSYVIFGSVDGQHYTTAVDQMGTSGNDTLTGSAAAESMVGGAGIDTLIGNGGNDVLYGGAGNDQLTLNADNVAQLFAGPVDGRLARVDGGSGIDTLQLDGANIVFDLSTISRQGAGTGGSRIESIEKVDVSGGNNLLVIGVHAVLDMSGMNVFNDDNGWTGLGSMVAKHQLVVTGDSGSVTPSNEWTLSSTPATDGARSYAVYESASAAAQLLVDTALTVTTLP
jgi:Ca2+-binding RTX toxin-like protein